jgi:hypothetical protein
VATVLELIEGIPDMALLDLIVDANFRTEESGRVVILPGGRRHTGYLIKSAPEELKIRSFLKMFYFAQFSILILGYFLLLAWSLGRVAGHTVRSEAMFLGIYFPVVLGPYLRLWWTGKNASLSFVSAQDEIAVSGKTAGASRRLLIAGAAVIVLAMLLAGVLFIRGI